MLCASDAWIANERIKMTRVTRNLCPRKQLWSVWVAVCQTARQFVRTKVTDKQAPSESKNKNRRINRKATMSLSLLLFVTCQTVLERKSTPGDIATINAPQLALPVSSRTAKRLKSCEHVNFRRTDKHFAKRVRLRNNNNNNNEPERAEHITIPSIVICVANDARNTKKSKIKTNLRNTKSNKKELRVVGVRAATIIC